MPHRHQSGRANPAAQKRAPALVAAEKGSSKASYHVLPQHQNHQNHLSINEPTVIAASEVAVVADMLKKIIEDGAAGYF
jgi:hypothetical protein